jgi:DNA-binding CsgD family transcriptional regulator
MEKLDREILQYFADGKKQSEIARLKKTSQPTIATRMRIIRGILSAKSTPHAIAIAFRQKLIK